jgi:beta-lactam-binding protein with PASTA domain
MSAVPNVSGEELDQAEATLLSDSLGYKVFGGGLFGVVIASDWTVCSQTPAAGTSASSVNLVVARACS